jgi:DNA-binding NarL/FixJ family response regulator
MGSRARKLALTGPAALTGSERRVARMAADGMTNNGIAQTLFVTVNAMKLHLTNAYRELGITSRVQLSAALEDPHGDELLHKDSVL